MIPLCLCIAAWNHTIKLTICIVKTASIYKINVAISKENGIFLLVWLFGHAFTLWCPEETQSCGSIKEQRNQVKSTMTKIIKKTKKV